MRVYFTFEPRPDLREPLVAEFPQVEFVFEAMNVTQLQEADILVTYGEDLTDELIAVADKLQWIFVASAGIEKMPAEAIAKRGIYVSNVRGIHKKPMAESVLAHILALKRGLPEVYELQKRSEWKKYGIKLSELNGSKAMIIGPGAIGQEIGRLLQAFEVHTIGINSMGEMADYMNATYPMADLIEHLPKADIVISILPSTDKTKYLLQAEHFKAMKSNALFMNFGRGDLVDEAVLVEALQSGEIGHVVLDVFEEEPLPATSALWALENVTVSPHISSHSRRYVERSLEIFKPSLKAWLNGEHKLENEIDILRGY